MRTVFFGLSALNRNVNLMISSMLLGVIIWVHEKCSPYKYKNNNITEALSLLNLHVIFVASLYTTTNKVAVNVSVSLAILHLLYIILFHVKKLLCSTIFQNTHFSWEIITKSLNRLRHKDETNQNHALVLINPIPEVAHNYELFQESLIGHDN